MPKPSAKNASLASSAGAKSSSDTAIAAASSHMTWRTLSLTSSRSALASGARSKRSSMLWSRKNEWKSSRSPSSSLPSADAISANMRASTPRSQPCVMGTLWMMTVNWVCRSLNTDADTKRWFVSSQAKRLETPRNASSTAALKSASLSFVPPALAMEPAASTTVEPMAPPTP